MNISKELRGSGYEDLAYWRTGEWQVIEERLQDEGTHVPPRDLLFRSLKRTPLGSVRCCIIGQDPYPSRGHATGVAFEVCHSIGAGNLPPTLKNIFQEYQDDLHYPAPKNGDLTKWTDQGVLLWNAYPSCALGRPGSHHWEEWEPLTIEIMEKLDERISSAPVVFVILGRSAARFSDHCGRGCVIQTSHPSPLGVRHGFSGSRIFSRVNAELCKLKQPTIDWRLPDETQRSQGVSQTSVQGTA